MCVAVKPPKEVQGIEVKKSPGDLARGPKRDMIMALLRWVAPSIMQVKGTTVSSGSFSVKTTSSRKSILRIFDFTEFY